MGSEKREAVPPQSFSPEPDRRRRVKGLEAGGGVVSKDWNTEHPTPKSGHGIQPSFAKATEGRQLET